MKILVIGHSVEDHILFRGKQENVKPGGIFYSTAAMNYFKEKEDEIFLATSISEKNYGLFEFLYKDINQKYFSKVEAIPSIHLTVFEDKERHEKYENLTNKLDIRFEELGQFDGILINMITGFDISIDDLKKISENYKGRIYLDVHSLARGMDENYIRNFRKIPEFNRWNSAVDIIQVNENEMLTLTNETKEEKIAEEILGLGVKIFIVTKGHSGAKLYFRNKNIINVINEEPLNVEVVNKIGCGDVFGAVFFYSYLKENNIEKSIKLANIAGACVTTYKDVKDLEKIKEDVFKRYN